MGASPSRLPQPNRFLGENVITNINCKTADGQLISAGVTEEKCFDLLRDRQTGGSFGKSVITERNYSIPSNNTRRVDSLRNELLAVCAGDNTTYLGINTFGQCIAIMEKNNDDGTFTLRAGGKDLFSEKIATKIVEATPAEVGEVIAMDVINDVSTQTEIVQGRELNSAQKKLTDEFGEDLIKLATIFIKVYTELVDSTVVDDPRSVLTTSNDLMRAHKEFLRDHKIISERYEVKLKAAENVKEGFGSSGYMTSQFILMVLLIVIAIVVAMMNISFDDEKRKPSIKTDDRD